eukprot:PLAT10707.1.p2 GENE.PLAT10707.1~~PLAT10707.1.p2  ORF type:complete len:227 (+),score=73.47 PLAT10707.1:74-682(+)
MEMMSRQREALAAAVARRPPVSPYGMPPAAAGAAAAPAAATFPAGPGGSWPGFPTAVGAGAAAVGGSATPAYGGYGAGYGGYGGYGGYSGGATAAASAATAAGGRSSSSGGRGPPGCNLFIRNLPYDVNDSKLMEYFAPYGTIISATVLMDKMTGCSKGCGFVSYDSPAAAQSAISYLNGMMVDGRRMAVLLRDSHHGSKPY